MVYHTEEGKIYKFLESKSDSFISMAFSPGDARFLVCLTKGP